MAARPPEPAGIRAWRAGCGQPFCVQGWGNLPVEVRGEGGARVSLGRRDQEAGSGSGIRSSQL